MSCLSYCKDCGGWIWGPGPGYIERLVEIKLEELKKLTPEERRANIEWSKENPFKWPPLRPGECGCGRPKEDGNDPAR